MGGTGDLGIGNAPGQALMGAPLVREVRAWLPSFVRAIRACRLYPANSGMRDKHLAQATAGLTRVLGEHPSITLGVRDGAFYCGDEEVFLDDDVRTGPTHFLTGHAIFELSFTAGLEPRELVTLACILAEDPAHRRRLGEDLVTLLWRFQLEHIRHRAVDVLSVAVRSDQRGDRAKSIVEDEETERLRVEQDRLVHLLAVYEELGRDLLAEIDGPLEAVQAWQQALSGEEARFRAAIGQAERRMSRRYLEAIRLDVEATRGHDHLMGRLSDLLLEALRAEPDPSAPGPALALLVRLFEGMLRDAHFEVALRFLERVRAMASRPSQAGDARIAAQIAAQVSGEDTVRLAVLALDRLDQPEQVASVLALLRTIGEPAVPILLSSLTLLERPEGRRHGAGLALELTALRRTDLHRALRVARWEVALELLEQSRRLPPDERAELIAIGLASPHPAVRLEAARGLLAYAPGRPDELLGRLVRDGDPSVRTLVLRALALRRSSAAVKVFGALAGRDDVFAGDPGEARALLVGWASVAGASALPELERLLVRTTALTSAHRSSASEAVAFAISTIDGLAARDLLGRGARSLNPRLRGPCKAALEQGGRAELTRLYAPLTELGRGELGNWQPGQSATALVVGLPEWPSARASRGELVGPSVASPLSSITADLPNPFSPSGPLATPTVTPLAAVPSPAGDLDAGAEGAMPVELYGLERLPSDAIIAELPGAAGGSTVLRVEREGAPDPAEAQRWPGGGGDGGAPHE